ncbi:sensor histidine kinase [Micromonospora sp. CA-111912]|uniref:sensor histidine kinase n=1 Tax=Micromonospora sp. CA-111912 TaxID=3239955 RepID=UPI003D8C871F
MTSAVVPDHPWLLPGALADVASSGARPRRTTRDWLVDALLFLFALGWAVAAAWDAGQPDPELAGRLPYEWLQSLDTVLGLLACAALWFRRRWPLGLAVATLPLGLFSATAAVALVVVMFTVVVHRPLSQAALVFGGCALTSVSYAMLRPDPAIGWRGELAWAGIFTGSVLAWGMFVRARRQLILSLRDRADRAEAEQQLRVAQARQLERTRIAREMHDVLAHRISLLSLHAGALEFRPDAPPQEVARAAGVIRESAHAALQDLREVIGVLRAEDPPPPGPASSGQVPTGSARSGSAPTPAARSAPEPAAVERPQPTLADVPGLVAESRAAGMRVEVVDTVEAAGTAPAALGRGAYRIVQEGLTNARKHAPGAAVTVRLSGAPGEGLTVDVRNRWPVGTGSSPVIPGTGTGLVGVAERVSLAGGRLEHGRDGSGDFRLTAWLPWPA